MNKKYKITFNINDIKGRRQTYTLLAEVIINDLNNSHDEAGLMFATEFAINESASRIYGKNIMAHIFEA